jgi:Cell division cycle-associated protein 8
MPSSTLFNPALPKTPAYPRRPRANESLLSTNGSPLTNPYESTYLANGDADSPVLPPGTGNAHIKLERQRSIAVLHGPSLSQPTTSQPSQTPALEVVLSIKVPTNNGNILEFDPLVTSPGDLELLEGVSDAAKRRAKEELQELSGLMTRLGKWRI